MTTNPLFSVLMANYNDGCYINVAIDSIKNKNYSNWEIIIVDDASQDNSDEIYKKYESDPRIHIFFNEKNYGCGFTKRRLVDLAKGEICGFVDADDALTEDAINTMVNAHIEHPEASLIYSRHYICDKNLDIISISDFQRTIPTESSFLEIRHGAISHFATFKKKYYLQTDGISISFKTAEDHDLYFKLEEVGSTIFVNESLYYYRCNTSNNISLGDNFTRSCYWDILAIYDACKRRRKSIDNIVIPCFDELIQSIITETRSKTAGEIINTKEFKLGSLIYKPINKLLKFIKKR